MINNISYTHIRPVNKMRKNLEKRLKSEFLNMETFHLFNQILIEIYSLSMLKVLCRPRMMKCHPNNRIKSALRWGY